MLIRSQWAVRFLVIVLVGLAAPVMACQVPVFRYALENWDPEPYLLLVPHRDKLSAKDKELIGQLEQVVREHGKTLNLDVKVVDLSQSTDPVLEAVLGPKAKLIQSPQMVLVFPFDVAPPPKASLTTTSDSQDKPAAGQTAAPSGLTPIPAGFTPVPPGQATCPDGKCGGLRSGAARLAWRGELTAENIGQLAASPARKQIIDRLLAGQSAVWVLLESGDKSQDDAAAAQLEKSLAEMQRTLKLPDKKTIETDESFKPGTKIELRLEFSVVRIPHQRGDDALFATTLLNGDPDVAGKEGPVAMAIFGRGRSYYALAGADIKPEGIEEHSRFLGGDCSCQVKAENPGFDLLTAVDWQKAVMGSSNPEDSQPQLSGIGVLAGPEAAAPIPAAKAAAMQTKPEKNPAPSPAPEKEALAIPTQPVPATAAVTTPAPVSSALPWIIGPAAIGLIVILIGNIWLRRGKSA